MMVTLKMIDDGVIDKLLFKFQIIQGRSRSCEPCGKQWQTYGRILTKLSLNLEAASNIIGEKKD